MRANLVELKLSDRLLVTSVVTSLAQPFGVDRFFFMGTLSRNVPTVKIYLVAIFAHAFLPKHTVGMRTVCDGLLPAQLFFVT